MDGPLALPEDQLLGCGSAALCLCGSNTRAMNHRGRENTEEDGESLHFEAVFTGGGGARMASGTSFFTGFSVRR